MKTRNLKTRFKKGDLVQIMIGKFRGKQGLITKINRAQQQVFMEGIMVKKHVKPNQENESGGIKEVERGIPWSNIALVDPKNKKTTTRVRYRMVDGKKQRFAVKSKTKLK